jgi:hypothetical protein
MAQVITLLALIVGFIIYVVIDRIKGKRRAATDADEAAAEDARAWQRIKALLTIALPDIITDAENKYLDPSTGELKMSYAAAKIIELIPPEWRGRIKSDTLQEFIEKALEGAKAIWNSMPGTLFRTQIEKAQAEMEAEEGDATVPQEVIDNLNARGEHLEVVESGRISICANDQTYGEWVDGEVPELETEDTSALHQRRKRMEAAKPVEG